jgi:dihydroorotate dehydrogenase electron transfer subunit
MNPTRPPIFETTATVLSQTHLGNHDYEIVFDAPEIAQVARPGQFLAIRFGENYAPLLRRPFSIYRADTVAGTLSVLYKARGAFTSGLACKIPGETIELLGALGKPFVPPSLSAVRHLLIAGGYGVPPMAFLSRELCTQIRANGQQPNNVIVINGARTADLLVGMVEIAETGATVIAVTDDGTQSRQGLVTDVLAEFLEGDGLPPVVYACGPMPMIHAVKQ